MQSTCCEKLCDCVSGWRSDEKRTSDRRVPACVRQQHGQGDVDVEPEASEPFVHFRIASERVHHVVAQQQAGGTRNQREKVRQGPYEQPVGDSGRQELLRRVHVPDQEHTRREQRANHAPGGAQAVQSVSGPFRRHHR